MPKGPVKAGRKATAPRLERRATEGESPGLKQHIAARSKSDTLDVSRRGWGPVTGKFLIIDAFGVERAVAFEQGMGKGRPSKLYDHAKVRILRPGEELSPVASSTKAKADAAEFLDDDDDDGDPPMDLSAIPGADDDAPVGGDDDDVNLTAWAEGGAQYRWALVRDAIETRYGRTINDQDEARDFLAENGIGRVSKRNANPEIKAGE